MASSLPGLACVCSLQGPTKPVPPRAISNSTPPRSSPRCGPCLALLSPAYLADGAFREVLGEARDYGQDLRRRLDLVLRQDVLPVLGRELGRWARADGRDLADDDVRAELEAGALLFVFRALFVLYAESAGHLPMANPTYRSKSLTRIAERAYEERDAADTASIGAVGRHRFAGQAHAHRPHGLGATGLQRRPVRRRPR